MPDNKFDKDLSPNGVQPTDKLYELEAQKFKIVEKYLSSSVKQKTQITNEERAILCALELIAYNPYSISQKIQHEKTNRLHVEKMKGKPQKTYQMDCLKTFIESYYELGIPVDRKGREEEKEILAGALNSNPSMMIQDARSKMSILEK